MVVTNYFMRYFEKQALSADVEKALLLAQISAWNGDIVGGFALLKQYEYVGTSSSRWK
jgi:hypothetical protein